MWLKGSIWIIVSLINWFVAILSICEAQEKKKYNNFSRCPSTPRSVAVAHVTGIVQRDSNVPVRSLAQILIDCIKVYIRGTHYTSIQYISN